MKLRQSFLKPSPQTCASSLYRFSNGSPNFAGNSTVALRINHATGFKSLAIVVNQCRIASKGMLPPPALTDENLRCVKSGPCDLRRNPFTVLLTRRVLESTLVVVRVCNTHARSLHILDRDTSRDRITMNPQHMQKPRPVGVGGEEARQHRRAAGDERPAGEPDVEPVGAGNGVIERPSRRLSIPISAIGSHSSMRRRFGALQVRASVAARFEKMGDFGGFGERNRFPLR